MAPAITGLVLIGFCKRETYERGSFWRGDNPLILPLSTPGASRDVLKRNTFVRAQALCLWGQAGNDGKWLLLSASLSDSIV